MAHFLFFGENALFWVEWKEEVNKIEGLWNGKIRERVHYLGAQGRMYYCVIQQNKKYLSCLNCCQFNNTWKEMLIIFCLIPKEYYVSKKVYSYVKYI